MNAVLLEQTAHHLERQTSRWDQRLRLTASLIWVPRGVMVGLLIGIGVAVISRLRPWLLPEQIALVAGAGVVIGGVGALAVIWLWPRSTTHRARYFDQRFGLKERVSTALEVASGTIPVSDRLTERQLSDAVNAARGVNVAAWLPLRTQWKEMLAVIALAALLIYLLAADNPHTREIRAQRDLQNAINEQAAALEQAIQEIEENAALSAEEQQALTQPLDQALDILQQPDVSQEEAVAALAEAAQSLEDLSDGMSPQQESAYQQAADQLAGSDMTGDMADALKKPDLGETAEAMDELADDLGENELSEQERQELAEKLEQAANALEESNPALAEKLREAARALREGDIEAAQKALREAAELARQQEEQLQNSPMAQAAQQATQQTNENQREMARAGQQQERQQADQQAGQPQSGGLQPQSQTGQQGQPQPGQEPGQEGQPGLDEEGQPGSGEQVSEPGEGQSQTEGEGQVLQEGGEIGEPEGQGEGQSDIVGPSDSGEQPGEGGTVSAQSSQGQLDQGSQTEQQGSLSAGTGEGGAGTDTTTGTTGEIEGGEISTDNSPEDGGLQEYDPVYDPSTIGGESGQGQIVDVGGESTGQEGETIQEGEFGPNPEGESMLSYASIFSAYRNIVSNALESGRIPLDQRDVIHDYFSSLER
jgi:hypothetical protein